MFDTSDEAANRSRRLQVSTPLWFNCVTSLLQTSSFASRVVFCFFETVKRVF